VDLTREDVSLVLLNRSFVSFEPRPPGLLDVQYLAPLDGGDPVTLSQWSGPAEVPGAVAYRRHRAVGLGADDRPAGCVVLVSVEFDRAGVAEEWVDLVLRALASEEPHPGGIAACFHVGLDGRRVLNYALWTSAQAHQDALDRGDGAVGSGEPWRRVRSFQHLSSSEVVRHRVVER
jgi:hypothetical protein